MAYFDGTDDTFDSREVIERIAELENILDTDATMGDEFVGESDEAEELVALLALKEEADGESFEFGVTFISDDYFDGYARELAEDLGMIPEHEWPANYIDWEAAADALKMDYTPFEFRGTTYWAR